MQIPHSGENSSGSISLYCWHSMIGKNMTLLQSKNFFYNNSVATMWCVHPLNFWPFTCNCIFRKLFSRLSWTFQGKCIIGQSFAGKLLLHSNAPTRSLKSLHLKMFWGRLFCAGRLVFLGRKEAKKIDIARRIEGAKPLMFIVHICSWRL